jgi:toxin ParE1/3/4
VILRFTPAGRRHLLAAVEYIARDDPRTAARFRARAERALSRLERFPRSGRPLPEFPDLPHREVIVRPYRFSYRVGTKVVWVFAVWHGAQEPERPE